MLRNISKKWLIVGVTAVVIISIGGFVKLAIDNMYFQPHGYLEVVSVPTEVSYRYGDKVRTITNSNMKPVPIGNYDIVFSAKGFKDATIKINIEEGKTSNLAVQLIPESNTAKKEANDEKYDRIKEYTTAYRMDTETDDILKKNPIINILPLLSKDYTAQQCEPFRKDTINRGNIGICIEILEPSKYTDALNQLSNSGADDINKYDIIFNDAFIYPTESELEAGQKFTLLEPIDYGHSSETTD